ncbi:unnamed protein product [Lampetra planeri]
MVELGSLAELNGVSLFVDECHVAGAVAGAEGQCPDPRAAPRSPTPPPTSSAACRPPCSRREHGSGSSSTRSRESGVGGGPESPTLSDDGDSGQSFLVPAAGCRSAWFCELADLMKGSSRLRTLAEPDETSDCESGAHSPARRETGKEDTAAEMERRCRLRAD